MKSFTDINQCNLLLITILNLLAGELFDVHTMCRVCNVLNYIKDNNIKR